MYSNIVKELNITDSLCLERVIRFLEFNKIPYKEDFLLRYETYFKTGGSAKIFIEPINKVQLLTLVNFLISESITYKVIGLTSNIYFLDELTYGIIISTKSLRSLCVQGSTIDVESGHTLESLVRVSLIHKSPGFEGLEGIPGSVGGSIIMNAGAYGYCISDNLLSVTVIDEHGAVREFTKEDCEFKHRSSKFKDNQSFIIVSAKFTMTLGDQNEISKKIRTYHIARHSYQEFSYPNLGSLFSINGDFYREIFRLSLTYSFYCILIKVLLRNSFAKTIMRKNPNNILLNSLVFKYTNSPNISDRISEKSFNILINDGSSNFIERIKHVYSIKALLKDSTPVENEFVLGPIMNESNNIDYLNKLKNELGDINYQIPSI